MNARSVLFSLLLLLAAAFLLVGEPLRAQGVWTDSFNHLPNDLANPTIVRVDPASDSIAFPSRWITQNLSPANQVLPGQRMNTVHVCLIPSGVHRGEVLVWDGNLTNYGTRAFQPWSIVNPYWPALNPNLWPGQSATQYRFHNATEAMPPGEGELFCAGQCWMPDGRLLVAGGTKLYPVNIGVPGMFEGAKFVYQWDPVAQTNNPFGKWYQMADLETERWYPTVTYEGTQDHRAIVIGGTNYVPGDPASMAAVNSYEVVRVAVNAQNPPRLQFPNDFDRKSAPSQPTWPAPLPPPSDRQYWGPVVPLPGYNLDGFGDYPRIHALGIHDQILPIPTSGPLTAPRLFVSGFLTWGIRWSHDWRADQAFSFTRGFDIGQMPIPGSDGYAVYATSLLLPGAIGAISNTVGRFGGYRFPVTNFPSDLVETVNVNASPTWWQSGPTAFPKMLYNRHFGNVVMLPTGELFAVGGKDTPTTFGLIPELFVGGTTWVAMAPHASPRGYHSAAILLPDGRVLVCGGEGCTVDYQIWEPPYLHRDWGGERPQGVAASDAASGLAISEINVAGLSYGQTCRATWVNQMQDGVVVDKVVLMRPEALTHHDDGGQRMVRLLAWDDGEVPTGTAGSIVFNSPATDRHAPRGWWMLFLVTSTGVPSVAYWVNLG